MRNRNDCPICNDAASAVRILTRDGSAATCEDRERRQVEIALDFVPDAQPGDLVLVHSGVALAKIESRSQQ